MAGRRKEGKKGGRRKEEERGRTDGRRKQRKLYSRKVKKEHKESGCRRSHMQKETLNKGNVRILDVMIFFQLCIS